ncbi:hypothetical protein [Kribbella shirazensis]|uniref:Uncharacterized protein n=1 Tax=Kribbella shirazensis TaxID=1105143 RepID=A0A7X6A1J9_9ACTN|nr:hypothetical protein [Kribbella shirazensis]NIK58053.1 hypothetical protein [Kribbella shirazensis]
MPEPAQRVPEDSAAYREFARLYNVARQLRPTGVDRWNRELYATRGPGYFDQRIGAIGVNENRLRQGLTLPSEPANSRVHAAALATVLRRASQAGMALDAPGEANAVRTDGSLGLSDGVASLRVAGDFQAFSRMAGYPRLAYDGSQETGASAAANGLVHQASGPRLSRGELLNDLSRGPVAMQFDRLAEGVVRNRLEEVAPAEGVDRRAMRAELIGTMLHPRWEELAQRSPEAGRQVADEIGRALNAKVDELRRTTRQTTMGAAGDGVQSPGVERLQSDVRHAATQQSQPRDAGSEPRDAGSEPRDAGSEAQDAGSEAQDAVRFLRGVAPAAEVPGSAPALGDGSRVAARASVPRAARVRNSGEPRRR